MPSSKTSSRSHSYTRLGKIVDDIAKQVDEQNYEKYSPIMDLAVQFFRSQPVLMYGGTAINDLLPHAMQFYPRHTLPDLDVFTCRPKQVAKEMVAFFKRHGHPIASFGPALHEGTFKVFVSGLQVADISGISRVGFKTLTRNRGNGSLNIPIANRQFLLQSLFMMLSQPLDAHRWEKVYERLQRFLKVFPPPARSTLSTYNDPFPIPDHLFRAVKKLATKDEFIMGGAFVAHKHIGQYTATKRFSPEEPRFFDMYVMQHPLKAAKAWADRLDDPDITVSSLHEEDDFVSTHAYLMYKGKHWIGFFECPACISFVNAGKYRYASIATILNMMLGASLSSHAHLSSPETGNLIHLLLHVFLHGPRKHMLEPFAASCYGVQPGVITMKRIRFEKAVDA